MRKPKIQAKGAFGILLVFLFFLGSCSDEPIDLNDDDTANVQNETSSDAYFAESEDLTAVTVSSDKATDGGRIASGSRVIFVSDPRLLCAVVTLDVADNSTLLVPKGTLAIDFGTGCTDAHGTVRKGKITITYSGRRFLPGSSVVTSLQDYEINGVKIEGTRTVSNASASSASNPIFATTMENGKITWTDGSTILRDERSTSELKLGATPDENQWFVNGSATGTNRKGKSYSMTITKQLVYKRSCAVNDRVFIAVEGVKALVVENKKIAIDYGNGACDKKATVTIKSKTKEVELN